MDENTTGQTNRRTMSAMSGERQSAKSVLVDMIRRKERELDNLRILHSSLPDQMLPQAEEALWNLLISARG
jgi:hypothetical protein